MICAGLDIGGTKIEARLFDADLKPTRSRRVPTPRDSAEAFFAALGDQVGWLRAQAGAELPIGIAMTGVVEPATGLAQTANLPISGQPMAERLAAVAGRPLPVMNDAMALAFSEANGGAAKGAAAAVGLIQQAGLIAQNWLAISVALVVSTLLTLFVTVLTFRAVVRLQERRRAGGGVA